ERVRDQPDAEAEEQHRAECLASQVVEGTLESGGPRLCIHGRGEREGPHEPVDRAGTEMTEPGGGRHPPRRGAVRRPWTDPRAAPAFDDAARPRAGAARGRAGAPTRRPAP